MKTIASIYSVPTASSTREWKRTMFAELDLSAMFAMTCAILATSVSLAMVIYISWHSSGLIAEKLIRMLLGVVVVLSTHWLPLAWPLLRGYVRFVAYVLWAVAIATVLYGQVTFFIVSQQHAGDLRAAAVTVPAAVLDPPISVGRTRTEIAKEATKASTNLARAQVRPCVDDCPALKVLRIRLAGEIAALKAEDEEVQRRDASEDRYNLQGDRIDQLRTTLRADPVVFRVASWLGTTERFLELLIGLAHAVVLEGAAIVGWMWVAIAKKRAPGRAVVVSDGPTESLDRESAEDKKEDCLSANNDDQLLERVHLAVISGEIKPTQESIRKLLRCGQPKAGNLNRQYSARFGSMLVQG